MLTADGEPLKRYPFQIEQRFDPASIYLIQNAMSLGPEAVSQLALWGAAGMPWAEVARACGATDVQVSYDDTVFTGTPN